MDTVVEVEFKELCRICANPKGHGRMISIFEKDGCMIELLDKIKRYLPINVSPDDGFPGHVCISCVSKLNVCHELVQICTEADGRLQALKQQLDIETQKLKSPEHCDSDAGDNVGGDFSSDSEGDGEAGPSQQHDDIIFTSGEGGSGQSMRVTGDSQVAVIIAEKDEQSEQLPKLNIVLVNVPKEEANQVPISERVESALKAYRDRFAKIRTQYWTKSLMQNSNLNKKIPNFACLHCNLPFKKRLEMILHFQLLHPEEVWDCTECGVRVCGSAEVFYSHQELHQREIGTDSESELLNSMTCQLDDPVETFEQQESQYEVLPLGEYNPEAKGRKRINRIIDTLKRHKSIPPNMLQDIIQLLKNYDSKIRGAKVTARKKERLEKLDFHRKRKCEICNRILLNLKSYKFHMISKHSPKTGILQCDHCLKFMVESRLKEHVESRHYGGKTLVCRFCDSEYRQSGLEQPHMWEVFVFTCPHHPCKRKYKLERHLQRHIETDHTQKDPVLCNLCGKFYKNKASLKFHVKHFHLSVHKVPTCKICKKEFVESIELSVHTRKYHPRTDVIMVPCTVCNKMVSKTYLSVHIKKKHSGKPFVCSFCGKKFAVKTVLKYHELRHQGIKSAKCPICQMMCKSPEAMERHKKRHEDGEPLIVPPHLQTVQCELCKKTLKNKHTLKLHLNIHLGIKPFECEICHQKFYSDGFLKLHMRKHSLIPIRSLCCQYCNKQLQNKLLLKDHEAKHRGEKCYACNFCDRKYFNHKCWLRHVKIAHKSLESQTNK